MRGAFAHDTFSPGEEIAHAITHGLGVLGSIAGLVLLIVKAYPHHDPRLMSAVVVSGSSMVVLYTASTFYHALTHARAKFVFQLLDHSAIYLLIAGSYTPFTLVTLGGAWGWSLFGVSWAFAVAGILYEAVWKRPWKRLSLVFYLAMGWMAVVGAKPLMAALPTDGLILLAMGGVAYSAGAVFYAWRLFPYHHAVWHVFVLAGSAFHYLCVYHYVIPS